MKIKDLKIEDIKVGMKIRSQVDYNHIGTIVQIDEDDDYYCWVQWPEDARSYGGFYGNSNDCEVVEC